MTRARTVTSSASVLLALCVLALPQAVRADPPPCDGLGKHCPQAMNDETARGVALGTGMRASAMTTSALAYNPAALVLGHLYHLEGVVDYLPALNTVALGGAVVDSATAKIAAGFGMRGFLSGDNGLGGIDGRLGLAFPFSDAVSIGLAGRYISMSAQQRLASGDMRTINLARGFTMDASLRIQAAQTFHLEVGTMNFLDLNSAYVPVMLNASAAFAAGERVSLGADLLSDVSTFKKPAFIVGGGVEVLAGDSLPLRAGYLFDMERKIHALSAGIGYTDRVVGFDLSFQQQIVGGNDTRVIGAVRYYVH